MIDGELAAGERSALAALRAASVAATPAARAQLVDLALSLCEPRMADGVTLDAPGHRELRDILDIILRELDRRDEPIAAIAVNNAIIALGGEGLAPGG